MNTAVTRLGKIGIFMIFVQLLVASCHKIDSKSFIPETPDISFPETSVSVSDIQDTIELPINANLPWRVKSNADWLTFISANGDGTGHFRVAIARNRLTESRTAEVVGYITEDAEVKMTIVQEAGEPAPDFTRYFYVTANADANNDGFSWEEATTLDAALDRAADGDFIYLSEGAYVPTVTLTGGNTSNPRDNTFEITKNVHLVGGYPVNAVEGTIPNPTAHPVILSGNGQAHHVVVVTAIPENEHHVSMKGITISKGHAGASGAVTVNGVSLARNYGGGLVVVKSKLLMEDCQVFDNASDQHIPGVYILSQANVTMRRTIISTNIGKGNGGGIWNDGSTLYMYDSEIVKNIADGVGGGLYSLNVNTVSYNYLYNVTIAHNQVGLPGYARVGAGIYSRERSQYKIVNSTIYGNMNVGEGFGAGITAYGGSTIDIINTTISNNEGGVGNTGNNGGAGLFNNNAPTQNTVRIYNSIISGNVGHPNEIGGGNIDLQSSIAGTAVYNYDKAVEPGQSFDPTAMFAAFAHYGNGFGATIPVIVNTPASTFGMTPLQLQILAANLALDEEYYLEDQNKKPRTSNNAMGAALPE